MVKKLSTKIKTFFKKFFLINDSPAKVAGGAAVGIFMGIVPGEGVISTLVVASILRLNRLSATAGVLASNMWATILVLPIATFVGAKLFHVDSNILIANFNETYKLGIKYFFNYKIFFEIVIPLMVGFIISALAIALAFFFLLYFLLKHKKVKFK